MMDPNASATPADAHRGLVEIRVYVTRVLIEHALTTKAPEFERAARKLLRLASPPPPPLTPSDFSEADLPVEGSPSGEVPEGAAQPDPLRDLLLRWATGTYWLTTVFALLAEERINITQREVLAFVNEVCRLCGTRGPSLPYARLRNPAAGAETRALAVYEENVAPLLDDAPKDLVLACVRAAIPASRTAKAASLNPGAYLKARPREPVHVAALRRLIAKHPELAQLGYLLPPRRARSIPSIPAILLNAEQRRICRAHGDDPEDPVQLAGGRGALGSEPTYREQAVESVARRLGLSRASLYELLR